MSTIIIIIFIIIIQQKEEKEEPWDQTDDVKTVHNFLKKRLVLNVVHHQPMSSAEAKVAS